MVGVICAMDSERDSFLSKMESYEIIKEEKTDIYVGKIDGVETAVFKCGIGKTLSSLNTTLFIKRFRPDYIVNVGCSGSISAKARVGDVVISDIVAHHDMDVFDTPRKYGEPMFSFNPDKRLVEIAKTLEDEHVHVGPIASGDFFVYKDAQCEEILKYYPETLCVEMEGASIGQVCSYFDVPFIIIRSISDDSLVPGNEVSYYDGLMTACVNAADVAYKLIGIANEKMV